MKDAKIIIIRGNSGSGKTALAKALQHEFGEEAMSRWWREKDFSEVLSEKAITADMSLEDTVNMIINDIKTF